LASHFHLIFSFLPQPVESFSPFERLFVVVGGKERVGGKLSGTGKVCQALQQ